MTFDLVLNKDIPKYESSNGMRTAQLLSIKPALDRQPLQRAAAAGPNQSLLGMRTR